MGKRILGFLSVCAVIISATVLSIPIGGLTGMLADAEAAKQSTLTIGFMQKVDSLNPYVGLNDAAYVFYGLVYDALTVIDNDMEPTPDLAKSVWALPESHPDMLPTGAPYGSVWQYNLTSSAMWTDREPFTADDVVFNINLNADNYASMWAYQPYSFFMDYAEKIDEQTVRIHFYDRTTFEPMPASYAYLISIPMLPKHKLQALDPFYIGFNWTGVFPNEEVPIVGTGPFMSSENIYDEWLAGDHITLLKNRDYHWKVDKGQEIKFDRIVMQFFDDSTAMVYALRNKQIDVAAFPPQAYNTIKEDVATGALKNVTTFDGPKITQYWTEIGICANDAGPNPSRLDHSIRLAMAMATNKSYIIDQFYLGLGDEGSTLIPPVNTDWHYEPNATEKIQYNLTRAREILDAAGYIDGPDADTVRECTDQSWAVKEGLVPEGKPLVYEMLVRMEYPEEKDIAMYLEQEWAKIGIKVVYSVVDEATLGTLVYSYEYDTMIWYWSADIDPNYQLFVISKAAWGGWNDVKYTNASYEDNYTKSVQTLDVTLREEYVDNCQRIYYQDVGYIILAYAYQTYAWRNDTFSGWGDWEADPGRSVDNFWMGNPLYFDLVYLGDIGDGGPPWLLIAAAVGVIAAVVAVVVVLKVRGKKGEKISESPLGD